MRQKKHDFILDIKRQENIKAKTKLQKRKNNT